MNLCGQLDCRLGCEHGPPLHSTANWSTPNMQVDYLWALWTIWVYTHIQNYTSRPRISSNMSPVTSQTVIGWSPSITIRRSLVIVSIVDVVSTWYIYVISICLIRLQLSCMHFSFWAFGLHRLHMGYSLEERAIQVHRFLCGSGYEIPWRPWFMGFFMH